MAYLDLLEKEGIRSRYLVVMKPKRIITESWAVVSGNIFKATFTFGQVVAVLDDGVALIEGSTSSVSSGEFFYDTDTSELFVDVGSDPTASQMVVTYEIYIGTDDAHHNRIPTDDTSRIVYYEPLVSRSPNVTTSTSNTLFGFMPTFSANMAVSNVTQFLQEDLDASSFNKTDVDLYHSLGETIEADNIKLILKAMTKSINSSDREMIFNLVDRTQIFNQEFRNTSGINFYNSSVFSELDPDFEGRPVRQVFGVVDGFVPVNIDYLAESPTTSDNRRHVCINGDTNLSTVTLTVSAAPASTATRTFVDTADGIRVGDTINNTTSGEFAKVTVVDKSGGDFLDHTSWVAASIGDSISRSFVGSVTIFSEGRQFDALFGRDYTIFTDAPNGVAGFDFSTSLEFDLSMPSTLTTSDLVYATVYGHENTTTLGGSPFGSDSTETASLTDPVVILFQLFKDLGITEAELDTATFTALEASITEEIGFAIPKNSNKDFPKFKDLFIDIAKTLLLKIFLDLDQKWSISQIEPLTASDKSIADDEILKRSFKYNYKYSDIISDVIVNYLAREVSESNRKTGNSFISVSESSSIAKNLHSVNRQKSFVSLHILAANATTLAEHLSFILGDRKGIITIRTKNRFFDVLLDNIITVSRTRLNGFEFDKDIDRTRDLAVISTRKSLREITIEIDDQKGIENNSGSW